MADFKFYPAPNGEQYARFSTVKDLLDKPALIPWAVNLACEYVRENYKPAEIGLSEVLEKARTEYRSMAKNAADIGTEIHRLIENYIKTGADPRGEIRPEVENGFLAFLEWEKIHNVKWLESEFVVLDHELCVGGTVDAIAEIDGKKYLVDFKSSKAVYDEYKMQVAFYFEAYQREVEPLDGAGILRLDKETGFPEWADFSQKENWLDEFERLYEAFAHLTRFFYAIKKRRLKNKKTEDKK